MAGKAGIPLYQYYSNYGLVDRRLTLHPLLVGLGWVAALVVGLSVEYGMYPYNQPGPATYSTFTAVTYATLHRPAWALCLCWVVVMCHYGYGGPVQAFLAWKPFIPLSRLTYCAYLVHFIVLDLFWDNTRVMYKDQLLMSWVFISCVAVSLAFGLVLALLVESPSLNLEKLLMQLLTPSNKGKDKEDKRNEKKNYDNGGFVKTDVNVEIK